MTQPDPQPAAHILIVDDDERIRSLLRRFLMRNGFLVTAARGRPGQPMSAMR